MSRVRLVAVASSLLLTTVGVAGCGDDSSTADDPAVTPTSASSTPTTSPATTDTADTPPSTGGSATPPSSPGSSVTTEPGAEVIDVTVSGETITPSGEELDVKVGQPIDIVVTADAPGEIHVHSSPEQEYEYDAGSTVLRLDPIEIPSQVVIESHTLEKVIVTLQVQP